MRRIALNNNTNRKTVARKLEYLAEVYRDVQFDNYQVKNGEVDVKFGEIGCKKVKIPSDDEFQEVQIDDLITSEHTKLKPLSVTVLTKAPQRWIMGFEVSEIPAFGLLAEKSREKYGFRKNERPKNLKRLLKKISHKITE